MFRLLERTCKISRITVTFTILLATFVTLITLHSSDWLGSQSANPVTIYRCAFSTSLLLNTCVCGLRDFNHTSLSDHFVCFPRLSRWFCGFRRLKSLNQVNHSRICRSSRVVSQVVELLVKRRVTVECGSSSPEKEAHVPWTNGNSRIGLLCTHSVSGQAYPLCSSPKLCYLVCNCTEQADNRPLTTLIITDYHKWCRDRSTTYIGIVASRDIGTKSTVSIL